MDWLNQNGKVEKIDQEKNDACVYLQFFAHYPKMIAIVHTPPMDFKKFINIPDEELDNPDDVLGWINFVSDPSNPV